jgi:hypothetical protein
MREMKLLAPGMIVKNLRLCRRNVVNWGETAEYFAGLRHEAKVRFRGGLTLSCKRDEEKILFKLLVLSDSCVQLADSDSRESFAWKVSWELRE